MTTEIARIAATSPPTAGPAGLTGARSAATRTPASARVRTARVAAVASLVGLPLLVYALPAVLGHPVVPGDDLTQSLPLRELVGHDLRSGQLPIFDPYIWGGAPLLAGWNAGAAYPLTWLFAVMPGPAAWTVNLVAAAVTAGVGCYAFLRASRLGVLASWAGALTYAFGGAMVAQVPHVSLIIGMSWVPLALLALLRLTQGAAATGRSLLRWTAVLAGTVGLVILAGEPRAVTDAAVVLALYGTWRLARLARLARHARLGTDARGTTRTTPSPVASSTVPERAVWKAAAGVAFGALLGVGLGAVQLVPGLTAVATSQRGHVTAYLFGAGSLPVRWLTLLGVPDLLGGSGAFGQPAFFGSYNLTEVTGYVGLLPLVAAVALFARIRRHRPLPEWVVWEVVAAAGVLLALGENTPLWHVLIHVPLVGGQRLQSRAILVTDLALAVLLAYWLDGWASEPSRPGRPEARAGVVADGAARLLGAVPMLGVIGLVVAALTAGAPFLDWMGAGTDAAAHVAALRPWLVPSLVLALGALSLVVAGPRLAPARRGMLAATFVVLDLLVFVVTTVVAVGVPTGGTATAAAAAPRLAGRAVTAVSTSRVRPIAALDVSGRFAVYDPGLLYPSELATLGVPDTSAVDGTWSVQGYGSIVDGHYAASTGVHAVSGTGQNVFSPKAATDGVFDALSTSTVLVPSPYLIVPPRGAAASGPGTRRVAAGADATWFLGTPLQVRSATVEIRGVPVGEAPLSGAPRVGLLTRTGAVDWAELRASGAAGVDRSRATLSQWHAMWRSPVEAVGLVVDAAVSALVEPPVVTIAGGRSDRLDGVLQNAIVAPHWRYGGQDGAFGVFDNQRARAPLTLRALPGEPLRGAAVRRVSGPSLEPTSASVSSSRGVDVVRAVAALPGWTATWTPVSALGRAGGAAIPLAVHRLGVVQVVRVPPGRGLLTWHYLAPGLPAGEVLSGVSLALVVGLALALALTARARRLRRP